MFAPLPQYNTPAGSEIDKENYQPDFSFGSPSEEDCKRSLRKSRDGFEELLKQGRGHDDVQVWCDYMSWAEKHAPHDEAAILDRACQALVQDLRYRDDVRHLRLWVLRAKLSEHPFEMLASLNERDLFAQHALLYEAWATELERQRRFQDAERVFQLGLQRRAQPRARLQSHSDGFQKRMQKRTAREAKRLRIDPGPAAASQKPAKAHPEHPQALEAAPGGPSRKNSLCRDLLSDGGAQQARPMEEPTMDNIQQLIRDLHAPKSTASSPASVATLGSAVFDDPTYTQEVMSREVLGLLAGDVKRTPSRSCGSSLASRRTSRASVAPRAPPEALACSTAGAPEMRAAAEQCPAGVQKSVPLAFPPPDSVAPKWHGKVHDPENAKPGPSERTTASDAGQLFSAARDAVPQRSDAETRPAAVPGRSSLRRPSCAADAAENEPVRGELLMTAPPTPAAPSPRPSSGVAQGAFDESSVEFDFESANQQFELGLQQRSQCAVTSGTAPVQADADLGMYEDTCFKIHSTEASPGEPQQQVFSGFGSQSSGAAPWGNSPFGFAG